MGGNLDALQQVTALDLVAYSLLFAAAAAFSLFFVVLARRKSRVSIPEELDGDFGPTTIVLPCNRAYNQDRQNRIWMAVLAQRVPKQVVFVVESEEDASFGHIMRFLGSAGLLQQTAPQQFDPLTSVQIVVSGLSFHNSQKIHNMLVALSSVPQTENIVFLDDDVQINRLTVASLLKGLEGARVSTGYSVEMPVRPGFVDDLIAVYRAINLLAFSRDRVEFVWGGMFCLRWQDLADLQLGKIWADGCYSEDMTLGNMCRQLGLPVSAPELCMAINPLPQGHTFRASYCNYIRRQFYVLTTYMTPDDRRANWMALFQIFYGGGLVWAILAYFLRDLVGAYAAERGVQVSQSVTLFKLKLFSILLVVSMLGSAVNYAIRALTDLTNRLEFGADRGKYRRPAVNRFRTGLALILHLALMPVLALSVLLEKRITWGSTEYERREGRVFRVRKGADSEERGESLRRFADQVRSAGIGGYLVKQSRE